MSYLDDTFILNVFVNDSLMHFDHSIRFWFKNRDISDTLRFATGVRCSYHVFASIFFFDYNYVCLYICIRARAHAHTHKID